MTDNPDPQRQADISDAHHEGFGAGVAWADQTPDTGDELDAIKERASDPRRYRTPIGAQLADCRQSLTEAEASHQTETARLRERNSWLIADIANERIEWRAERDTLTARIAELEHTITQYLDSHGTAGTGELGKRLKAAVGRVE